MTRAVPYEDLDPGIREVVRLVNSLGFKTADSGDGVSKRGTPMEDGMLGIPHVAIPCGVPDLLVPLSNRLFAELKRLGVRFGLAREEVEELAGPQDAGAEFGDGVSIEATYDPADGGGIIMLLGLDDELLEASRARAAVAP